MRGHIRTKCTDAKGRTYLRVAGLLLKRELNTLTQLPCSRLKRTHAHVSESKWNHKVTALCPEQRPD